MRRRARARLDTFGRILREHAFIIVLVFFTIAQAGLLWATWDTRSRVSREELASRQSAISHVEECYRGAASRVPILGLLAAIEGIIKAQVAAAELSGRDRLAATSRQRLRNVQAFQRLTRSRTPRTLPNGRVPRCEVVAQEQDVRLELVGRNPDGTPRPPVEPPE